MGVTRVLHVASHRINVGDGALVAGIRRMLDQVSGGPYQYAARDVVDLSRPDGVCPFDPADLERHELVLIGGGGGIDGKANRTASGMACSLSAADVARSLAPIAYVALGYNLFPGETLHCREPLAKVVRACAERDFPFSVRNDGSWERMQEALGPAADWVDEVPDPGFFVPPAPAATIPQLAAEPGQPTVIVQLAGDNLARRLGTAGRRWFRRQDPLKPFVRKLADYVQWLIRTHSAEVVFAPHITRDLELTALVVGRLPPGLCRPHVRVLGVPHPCHANVFFEAYRRADLVVGMRGHSVICAVGHRTPCLAVSTHDKVSGFFAKCGLSDWSLSLDHDFDDRLRAHTSELLRHPERQLLVRDRCTADFESRFQGFMRRCWQQATASETSMRRAG